MFRTASPYGGVGARYRNVDLSTRVEGASPHRLVAILFEELLASIEAAQSAARQDNFAKRAERQNRALSILHALEASLDFDKGGEIAVGLSSIYREARRLISLPQNDGHHEGMEQARTMLADIAGAWASIG